MNAYELLCVLDGELAEGNLPQAEEIVKSEIARVGGEVTQMRSMGRRRLAYPLAGHKEGLYLVAHLLLPPEALTPLRNNLKLKPSVLRSLIIRIKSAAPIELKEEPLPRVKIEVGRAEEEIEH